MQKNLIKDQLDFQVKTKVSIDIYSDWSRQTGLLVWTLLTTLLLLLALKNQKATLMNECASRDYATSLFRTSWLTWLISGKGQSESSVRLESMPRKSSTGRTTSNCRKWSLISRHTEWRWMTRSRKKFRRSFPDLRATSCWLVEETKQLTYTN